MEYFPRIQYIENVFKNRPLVLFQEELKKDPFKFIDLIAEFVGATYSKEDIQIKTVKKAYSEKQLKCVRKFNRFYKFNKSKVKSKSLRFAYKKISAFLLHAVAYTGALIPESVLGKNPLIPNESIKKVNNAFEKDWQACIDYARETRKLYID